MASANPVEEQITCSVCMDVFREPYVLRECLHTFCQECIQLLEQQGQVQCPECRVFSSNVDIKRDFKTQGFIDAYRAEKRASKDVSSLIVQSSACKDVTNLMVQSKEHCDINTTVDQTGCGMCNKSDKVVSHRCVECEHFLCTDCQAAHHRIKACRQHTVMTTTQVKDQSKAQLTTTMTRLDNKLERIDGESQRVSEVMKEVSAGEKIHLDNINKYTEEAIFNLQQHQQRLKQTVLEKYAQHRNTLTSRMDVLTEARKAVQHKIDHLKQDVTDLSQTDYIHKVTSTANTEMDELVESLQLGCDIDTPDVTVKRNSQWVVEDYIQLDSVKQDPVKPINYLDLCKTHFVRSHTSELDRSPYVLCMVNDEVWCAGNYKIAVFNLQCQHLRDITIEKIRGARGLVSIPHSTQVLVACKNRGVHQIDTRGHYTSHVIDGSFSDICVSSNDVLVLEFRRGLIMVLKQHKDKWVYSRQIKLTSSPGSDSDRIRVYGAYVYVSSWNRSYSYTSYKLSGGEMLQKYTCDSHVDMLLCDIDQEGHLLVVDYSKGHVLICDNQQVWTTVNIEGGVAYPLCAMIDSKGCLWITEKWSLFSKAKIIKFSPKK